MLADGYVRVCVLCLKSNFCGKLALRGDLFAQLSSEMLRLGIVLLCCLKFTDLKANAGRIVVNL